MAHRRAKPIAPEEYNTITLATVALGRVSTSRPDMSDSARPFSIEFGPIRGAYVLCEQSSFEAQVPMPFAPFRLRMGRSDAHGWVIERDAGDIHDDPPDTEPSCTEKPSFAAAAPAPAKERMLLDAAEIHTLYWCYGRENFRAGANGTATAARLWQSGSRRLGVRA